VLELTAIGCLLALLLTLCVISKNYLFFFLLVPQILFTVCIAAIVPADLTTFLPDKRFCVVFIAVRVLPPEVVGIPVALAIFCFIFDIFK